MMASSVTPRGSLLLFKGLWKHNPEAGIAPGELQRIVAEKTSYTPQNVGHRLIGSGLTGRLVVVRD